MTEIICISCGELKTHQAKGMCGNCYRKNWRKNNTNKIVCSDCKQYKVHYAKGLCLECYGRKRNKNNSEKYRSSRRKTHIKYYKKNADKLREIARNNKYKKGAVPMSENKKCSSFLGCHIAERVLSHVFKDVVKMPPTHPGYDFICNKGKKIDVKSACLLSRKRGNPRWKFSIKHNKKADYFLCLGFDNRDDLNPIYMWLIPGNDVNNTSSISMTQVSNRMDIYKLDINKVITCCNELITSKT